MPDSKVFLSHNSEHKPGVEEIGRRLRKEGIDSRVLIIRR